MTDKKYDYFCLVDYNRDKEVGGGRDLYSTDPRLEMLAKMVAEEIHYEATWEWPVVGDDNEYIMIMPEGYRNQLYAWADEYESKLVEWQR